MTVMQLSVDPCIMLSSWTLVSATCWLWLPGSVASPPQHFILPLPSGYPYVDIAEWTISSVKSQHCCDYRVLIPVLMSWPSWSRAPFLFSYPSSSFSAHMLPLPGLCWGCSQQPDFREPLGHVEPILRLCPSFSFQSSAYICSHHQESLKIKASSLPSFILLSHLASTL